MSLMDFLNDTVIDTDGNGCSSTKSPSMDDSTTSQSLPLDLSRQQNKIESNQKSPIIPSPTICTVLPDHVNTIDESSSVIVNDDKYKLSLYDPNDKTLEITYCECFKSEYNKYN